MSKSSQVIKSMIRQSGLILLLALAVGLGVNQVRSDRLPLVRSGPAESRSAAADGLTISLEEARRLHETDQALFLDARPEPWFEMGHIQRARNLPPEEIDRLFAQVLGDVPPHRLIVTYCDGENCQLSHDLAFALKQRGFTEVRVLVDGWRLWQEAGLPIEGSGG